MTECNSTRDQLVLFAEDALDPAQLRAVRAHLQECRNCTNEVAEINSVRTMLSDPELFAPEQSYVWQLLPQTMAARIGAIRPQRRRWSDKLSSLAWTVTMCATLALTLALSWIARHQIPAPSQPGSVEQRVAPGNEAFVGRMQAAYAREATAKYLTQCQDLLIDVVRAEKNCAGDGYDVSAEVVRARELLAHKQLLDRELRTPDVARAKNLCDELERFLVNLSTSEKCETQDKLLRMEKFIQREQLLLRINVLQSELS